VAAALALPLALLACGDFSAPDNSLVPGQTDFTNTEPVSGPNGRHGGYGQEGDFSAGAPGANGSSGKATPAAPPAGRVANVEEADIYKVKNNRLFYLNTYRGFLIYDLKDPKHPVAISRLGVYGYPIEMYVKDKVVYALIKDALYLTQVKGKLQFKRHNTSQLVSIDISDMAHPKVLQTVDIVGQLREGVSRKVDDTVYVVSYIPQSYYYGWGYSRPNKQKEQAWVYSFNIANPKNLKLMDKLKVFEGGSYSSNGPGGYEQRYFSGVTISATANALMVVENWRIYGYLRGSRYNCGSYRSQQQARVTLVDISDPKGKIHKHTTFETWGQLGDQFKQTYFYNPKTKKGYYIGIFARREWSNQNCHGSSFTMNTMESWDVTNGNTPVRLSSVPFGKMNETVRGSVFDTDRMVAFAITARNVDPLYVISYQNPNKLKVLSDISGLSGDMSVFKFINKRQFIIGIGRDNTSTCTGYTDPYGGRATNVAVSIIDVRNLNDIRLVQRQCVVVKGGAWVSSAVSWNLDQAHKMIGMHSDGKVNVVTVPVYYYKKHGAGDWWYYRYETAVGVMSWDLSKYDKTKLPTDQKVLINHGTVIHPKGQVRRSIVFTHKGQQNRRMMINLSDTHVSVVDLQNLDAPVTQSVIEVAPYQAQIFRFGPYMVEHVRSGRSPYYWSYNSGTASEFRVKYVGVGGGDLSKAKELANFVVGGVERVMKWGNKLVLFRRVRSSAAKSGLPYYRYYDTEVLVYDLSNPTKPRKVGVTTLPVPYLPYYRFWCGPWGYWGGFWFDDYYYYGSYYRNTSLVRTGRGFTLLTQTYNYSTKKSQRQMIFLNLTGSKPTYKVINLTQKSNVQFIGLVSDPTRSRSFYLAYRVNLGKVQVGQSTFYSFRYYGQRWDAQGNTWIRASNVSLPGRLTKVWTQGKETRLLTYDTTYRKDVNADGRVSWVPTLRLNMLRERNYWGQDVAELLDHHSFGHFYLKGLMVDSGKLYLNARPNNYWHYWDNAASDTKNSDHLMIFDVSQSIMRETYAAPTGTYNVRLMGTYLGKLFLNLPGDGVLMVDTSNPKSPVGQKFFRTLGYATHLEFVGTSAYVASGYFGVYTFNLLGGATLPTSN